jgi:CRP/FNR family transcriptional regulator
VPKVAHRGETLYQAGQGLQPLYVIKAGSVKISIASAEGDDQVVRFHLVGDLVGADGLEGPRTVSTAVALETTGLCELPTHQLDALSQRFPRVQSRLIKHLSRQLSHAQTMLLVLGKRSAEERVATFLLDLMGRLEARGLSGKELSLSMTRCDIASYLGLAVETVSRTFRGLHDKGVLSVRRRRVRLRDVGALQALAGVPPTLPDSAVFPSGQKFIA